ncbi:MAG: hypothetical protein ACK5TN_10890 [Acidobacteriota bacterium]
MAALILLFLLPAGLMATSPYLSRVAPLGGQAGTVVEVEFTGENLGPVRQVRFDSADLVWQGESAATKSSVKGRIRIAAGAALGPHRVRLITADGATNSRLFNVNQFPSTMELEPLTEITLRPQVLHGYMRNLADQDFVKFRARAGERWLFDLESIERGGFLECSLSLQDSGGREIAHNEDRNEYLETPRLSFTFPADGVYTLKIDQYRGPQGVACEQNCGYQLQVSRLPVVEAMYPLGAKPGESYEVTVRGEALESVTGAYLRRARAAEHYGLTFPYSLPVDGRDRAVEPIPATEVRATRNRLEAHFAIPASAPAGLWRLWLVTRHGVAEAMSLEIDPDTTAINGVLSEGKNRHRVELRAGTPFHAWTLAAQLGLPAIDTVLELWSAEGELLAEHDDLMSGQGTVIGNPDSSLYYVPEVSGPATIVVADRTSRSGPGFAYRLRLGTEKPGFQLLYEPEHLSAAPGEEVEFEALLIKQPRFEKAVEVWVQGHPEARGKFRADQHFGPSGDGDNINIPAVRLKVRIPPGAAPGEYPIRLLGRAEGEVTAPVEALSTMWIGPKGKRNDTRRPLPEPAIWVR